MSATCPVPLDGKHSWSFDEEDRYIVCHWCGEQRDANGFALPSGWFLTATGGRLHAVLRGRALCGVRTSSWRSGTLNDALCGHCEPRYGPAFPAPPGREHHSSHSPWFGAYAESRSAHNLAEDEYWRTLGEALPSPEQQEGTNDSF